MNERMLSCREFIEFIMDWLDGELDPGVRREFAEHLEMCPDCVDYLESYRRTVALGKAAWESPGDAPVPDDVPEELVQAVLAARRRK
jgi:anti-sigma factor RsiW